jgi:O-succinylbenzoate synthase
VVTVAGIVLRVVSAELTTPFENRWQRYESWSKVVVSVEADGVTGVGECTAMPTPYYNYETVDTAWLLIRDYLAPLALRAGCEPDAATREWAHISGHEEAKAAVECALWDLRARRAGRPLWQELGGELRPVPAGATLGIHPTVDALCAAAEEVAAAGYPRLRVKIRPGWDLGPLRAVRSAVPGLPVIADANCAYRGEDVAHLARLDELDLMALEQPFPHDHLVESAELQRRLRFPICLDESITTLRDVRTAVAMGACRAVNVKVGRVGGVANAVAIHDLCTAEGLAAFVGAKYEMGVGRWTNLAVATLPGMTWPSDVGPSSRYYRRDGVTPPVRFHRPGWVLPSIEPGVGAGFDGSERVVRELVVQAAAGSRRGNEEEL